MFMLRGVLGDRKKYPTASLPSSHTQTLSQSQSLLLLPPPSIVSSTSPSPLTAVWSSFSPTSSLLINTHQSTSARRPIHDRHLLLLLPFSNLLVFRPMSRRPFALSRKQRPLSAIFIGSIDSNTSAGGNNSGNSVVGSVGSAILPPPDLPEPPSPSGSIGSGLPSPPATNSTGSGSVGDDSPNGGSIRKKKSVILSTGSSSSAIPSSKRPESRSEMFNGGTSYDKAQQHTQQQYQQQQQSGISGGGGSGGGRGRSSYVDDDDDDPNENDEDHTARLSLERRRSTKTTLPPDDNISALARVKSLTQRNRMVLDKLTSISRLSSPAPSKSRSPFPTTAKPTSPTASSSTSSSRHSSASYSRPMHAHSTSELPLNTATASSSSNYENPPSGSETEREPMNSNSNNNRSLHSYSSSDSLSATPTSTFSELKSQQPLSSSDYVRPRQISAPSSPQRNRNNNNHNRNRDSMERSRNGSPGPSSRTRGKRVSMVEDRRWHYESGDDDAGEDVTTAALAAVASSRRSPSSGRKARNPLPKEFRSGERRSMDSRPEPPTTPHRNREREREFQRRSPSPNRSPRGPGHHYQGSPHSSPRRQGGARYSTVRELTRKHQTRWLSEDLSASSHADREEDEPRSSSNLGFGRRQGSKNGSSESPLNGRLLGEGLRAAGLTTRRRDGSEDVFASPGASGSNTASGSGGGNGNMVPPTVVPNRNRASGSNSVHSGDWDSPTQGLGSTSAQNQLASGGTSSAGRPSHRVSMIEPRTTTPGLTSRQERADRAYATLHGRPGTSMAALHGDSPGMLPPRTAPPSSATFRTERSSPYGAEDVYGRNEAPLPPRPASRAYVSPFAPPRPLSTAPPVPPLPALVSGANGTTSAMGGNSNVQDPFQEHRRLMLEALSMFESHLSRIPPMGQTTTTTIPEVFQSSQHLVHTMDKLNSMLKLSTNKALEYQIEAEVSDQVGGDGTVNMAEVWTKVGMEHRDNLRLSDEVVRSMTGFLLGVGKVLREATSSSAQQQQQHLRTVSLDDEVAVRRTPEVQTSVLSVDRRSSDGRKSRETRRSWDPRETTQLTALTSLVPTTTNTTIPALTSTRLERGLTSRPGSSLNHLKSSSGHSSSEGRSVQGVEGTPQTVRNATSALVGSLRRPYTPRELRLAAATAALETPASDPQTRRERELVTYDSQETMQDYEPSPTPASRLTGGRVLAPLAIPPSLPTLQSETTLRRNGTITSSSSHTTPPTASSSNAGSSEHSLASRRKVSGSSNITVRAENSTTSGFQPIIKSAGTTTAVTPHTVSVSISPDTKVAPLPAISSRTNSNSSNELSHSRSNTVTFSRSATTLAGIRQQQRQEEAEEQERQRRLRTTSTGAALGRGFPHTEEPSPISLRSPMSGSETERPRTFAVRGGRVSLDSANSGSSGGVGGREVGRGGRVGLTASTLLSSRKERRRTITEIFSKT